MIVHMVMMMKKKHSYTTHILTHINVYGTYNLVGLLKHQPSPDSVYKLG